METSQTIIPAIATRITLRQAALIAGAGYILMFGTPIAEFLVMAKMIDFHDPASTVKNISEKSALFRLGIFFYFVNFIGDILAAWAVFILLKPAGYYFSLFTAWMRIIYTLLSLVAVMNLLTVLQWVGNREYLKVFPPDQIQALVMIALRSFRDEWSFAFIFFGLFLVMLGSLAFRSGYVSKIVATCLIIAGIGWLTDSLQPLLYPNTEVNIGMIAGVGELVFMFWLFIKGSRLKEPVTPQTG